MNNQSWGTPKDHEVWAQLLKRADDNLAHQLWCAVIREVAAKAIGQKYSDGEEETEERIKEWQNEALPANAHLALVLGELDYFRDIDLSWDEKISLAGKACDYASDVVWDLTGRLEEYPDARKAVTEEAVENFYVEWRTRFLRKVLNVLETMPSSSGTSE